MFTLRDKLSALLMDSAENIHYRVHIPLELKDNQGLSTNDMLTVESIWQDRKEGIIMLKLIGIGEPKELEDFEECIPQIYDYMNDYMSKGNKYILTQTDSDDPEYKYIEIFKTYNEASLRLEEVLQDEIKREGNVIESIDSTINSVYVLLNDGNELYWEITKK